MSLSIGNLNVSQDIYSILSPQSTDAASATATTALASELLAGGASPAASVDISGPGKLYSELQQLQQTDPAKFQQVVSTIASQLQAAAQQAGGSGSTGANRQAQMLSELASKFESVANGGDISQLAPSHHGHHHSAGAAAASTNAAAPGTASTDSDGDNDGSGQVGAQSGAVSSAYSDNTTKTSMEAVFASIEQEVSSALSGA